MSDSVRRFEEPRRVEVLHAGEWVPGWQEGWVRWPDGEWRASVWFVVQHEWGPGRHVRSVPSDCVRLVE